MQIYLSIQDDRQGPFTPEEISAKLQSGECNPETQAWREGLEGWQPLRDVLPKSKIAQPPSLPVAPPVQEMPAAKPAGMAGKGNAFLDFFRAYRGLFQRIKNNPLPQPAQWYDRYPIIIPAAFLAFFICGLGLIPLLLTSRLSGGDKGRLSLIAAWPLFLSAPPIIWPLLVLLVLLLPVIALVMMWVKKWFTPAVRYIVTGIVGFGVVCLIGLVAVTIIAGAKDVLLEAAKEASSTDDKQTKQPASSDNRREQGQPRLSKEEKEAGVYLTKSGYLAGVSKEAMDRAASFQVVGDSEALAALIQSGQVFKLEQGVKVQLMKTHVFSALVEVRPFGSTVNLWTNTEAIGQ